MIEAYEVGVSLVMSEAILESLALVNSRLGDTQQLIMGANAALKRMNSLTKDAAGSASTLAGAWKNIAASAAAASSAASKMGGMAAGGYYAGGSGGSGVRAPRPFAPSGYLGYDPGNVPAVIPGSRSYGPESWPGYQIPNYGSGGTPSGPDSNSNDYRPNWTYPSGDGADDAQFLYRQKLSLNGGRNRHNNGGGNDAFADMTGAYFGYGLLSSMFGSAAQIDALKANMLASGFTGSEVGAALNEANQQRVLVPGTSLAGNLDEILRLKSILGSADEAMDALPTFLKQGVVTTLASNGSINFDSLYSAIDSMARAGELSGKLVNQSTGKIDPAQLARFATDVADISLATGGRVTPADFLAMAQNAGSGVMAQLTDPALFGNLAPLVLSMGGARAGTALNALAQQFKGGKMSQYAARAMHDIGLLPDYMFDSHDKIKGAYKYGIGLVAIPTNALPNTALYNSNPVEWLMKVLIPAMEKHGYTTSSEQQNYLYKMLSRTPGIRGLQDLIANLPQVEKYYAQFQQEQSQNNYDILLKNNPTLQASALAASWQAFLAASGQTWMPEAIKMIDSMTDFLNAAGKFATKHPGITKDLAYLTAGFAALSGLRFGAWVIGGTLVPLVKAVPAAIKLLSKLNAITDTLVAGSGEIGAAAAGIAGVVAGLAEVGAVAWGAYDALDWMNGKLARLFNVPKTSTLNTVFGFAPTPPLIGKAENWMDKKIDGLLGWQYQPSWNPADWSYGSLVPSAAQPPSASSPQPVYVVGGNASVHVTNPRDIHNGVASSFTQQLLGIQTGPTGHDSSFGLPLVSGH